MSMRQYVFSKNVVAYKHVDFGPRVCKHYSLWDARGLGQNLGGWWKVNSVTEMCGRLEDPVYQNIQRCLLGGADVPRKTRAANGIFMAGYWFQYG